MNKPATRKPAKMFSVLVSTMLDIICTDFSVYKTLSNVNSMNISNFTKKMVCNSENSIILSVDWKYNWTKKINDLIKISFKILGNVLLKLSSRKYWAKNHGIKLYFYFRVYNLNSAHLKFLVTTTL